MESTVFITATAVRPVMADTSLREGPDVGLCSWENQAELLTLQWSVALHHVYTAPSPVSYVIAHVLHA